MRILPISLALLPLLANAQPPAPFINREGVIRSDTNSPGTLSPGTLFSVYGRHLGPDNGCHAESGMKPSDLCGVRILIGDMPAELSYVSEKQINARIPDALPNTGAAVLTVFRDGLVSMPTEIRLGPLAAKIALEGEGRVDGPVWIHVDFPRGGGVSYPVRLEPWIFNCEAFEVRKDGKLLTPISPNPAGGIAGSGPPCGFLSFPARSAPHTGRLPLHLQYRFDTPGTYEVRYSHRGMTLRDIVWQSEWTPIQILPSVARRIDARPQDPAEILSDFLPNLLALPNEEALAVFLEYLYHPSDLVRRYAALALYYWPDADVDKRLLALVRANGPTDVAVQRLAKLHAQDLVDSALPDLTSDDVVRRRGAISSCQAALGASLAPELRRRVEQALVRSADRVLSLSDGQDINNFVAILGQVHDEAGHRLLWTLVERNIGREQAVIAIAWRKDPADLPRLAQFLQPSLPNVLRNNYGAAALPYLRDAMERSTVPGVPVACAEELMYAGDAAGFAFALKAIGQSSPDRARLSAFLHDHFPSTQ
jgi:hypothetical protein